jgi:hypothetical protein
VEQHGYDEDEAAFVRHLDALGVPHPYRAAEQRLGLDRNTEEGALLAFSGALRPDRPSHRMVAWVLLVAFALPVVLLVLHLTEGFLGLLASG